MIFFAFQDLATYTCDSDFQIVGVGRRSCQASGRWSGWSSNPDVQTQISVQTQIKILMQIQAQNTNSCANINTNINANAKTQSCQASALQWKMVRWVFEP